jgi:hypothetical protein
MLILYARYVVACRLCLRQLAAHATGGFAWTFDRVAFNDTASTIGGRVVRPATFDQQLLWRLGWTVCWHRITIRAQLERTDRIFV